MITENDRKRIADSIRAAESRTSGEIFCVLAQRASAYPLMPFAWAAALGLLVPWPLIYLTTWQASVIYTLQVIAVAVMTGVLWRPALRYRLVSGRGRWNFVPDGPRSSTRRTDKDTPEPGIRVSSWTRLAVTPSYPAS